MGVAGTTLWRSEALDVLGPGETMTVGPYTLRFDGVTQEQGPNYQRQPRPYRADGRRTGAVAMLTPEQRIYPAEGQDTADTAIRTTGLQDLYLALGDDRGSGRWTLRAYVSPLAPFIWLGGLVMALGGMLSLWGRLRARRAAPSGRGAAGRMKKVLFFLLLLALRHRCCCRAAAPVADTFSDPAMEARARNLQRQLRCLVCQGESIDESGAPLAAESAPSGAPADGGGPQRPADRGLSQGPLWGLYSDEAAAGAGHLFSLAGAVSGLDWWPAAVAIFVVSKARRAVAELPAGPAIEDFNFLTVWRGIRNAAGLSSVRLGPAADTPDDKEPRHAERTIPTTPLRVFPAAAAGCWRWASAAAIVVVGLGAFALLPPVRQIQAASHDPVQLAANDTSHATPRMLENSAPFSFADLVERVSPAVVTITSETMSTANDEEGDAARRTICRRRSAISSTSSTRPSPRLRTRRSAPARASSSTSPASSSPTTM